MSLVSELREFASARGLLFCADRSNAGVTRVSVYSQDKTKRYAYLLLWQPPNPIILWVMLNPGTGDTEMRRRTTLDRCKDWSEQWGYGGLLIGNVFATRAKSAKALGRPSEFFDPINNDALHFLKERAGEVVVAWGSRARSGACAVVATVVQ